MSNRMILNETSYFGKGAIGVNRSRISAARIQQSSCHY